MRYGSRTVTAFTIEVLNVIEEFYLDRGYPPSLREISQGMDGGSTSAISYAMETLYMAGYLTQGVGGQSRTQVPTFKARENVV